MSRDPSRTRPRLRFTVPLEVLESRTLLNATADVGVATADVSILGDLTGRVESLYFYGEVSSPDARVDVYATPRRGRSVLIGQASPFNGTSWYIGPDLPLADGLYTIQARAVEASTGLVGGTATLAEKVNVDNVGPRVVGVRLIPRQGRLVVSFRDFGGDRNAGTGLDVVTLQRPYSYGFAPLTSAPAVDPDSPLWDAAPDPRWTATSVDVLPARARGVQRVVVTINDGAPIPDGVYRLYIRSRGPVFPIIPYYIHLPYGVWGIDDGVGNPLNGGATSTITPPDSNDFATAFEVRQGRVPWPGSVAPLRPARAIPAHQATPIRD